MKQPKRLRNATDVLTTIPQMVGYVPQNSLVLVPFVHGHGRACIRMDLPFNESAISPREYAHYVLKQVAQLPDTNEVILVVFTDEPMKRGHVPFAAHEQAIDRQLDRFGIRVRTSLCWATNGWSNFDGSETGSVEELDSSELDSVAASFADFAEIPSANSATKAGLSAAIRATAEREDEIDLPLMLFAWESLLTSGAGSRRAERFTALAIVTLGLRQPLMAECILANAAYGSDVAEELELVWMTLDHQDGQKVDSLITDRLETEPINLGRTSDGICILRELISALPADDAGHGYAAIGWLEWARGSSSLASHYASRALGLHPGHPLALAVAAASDSGITPGWISEVGVTGGFTQDDFDELLGVAE